MSEEFMADVIDESVQSILEQVHTALPGVIVTYDGTTATVKPSILKQFKNLEILPYPEISGVLVQQYRTSRGGIHTDLLPGDPGLIVFTERNIDNWALSGAPSIPADRGKFDLKDAIFIPGILPKPQAIAAIASNQPLHTNLYRTDAGIINFYNSVESWGKLAQDFLTAIISLTTINAVSGSPLTLSPTSIAQFTAIQVRMALLFGVL